MSIEPVSRIRPDGPVPDWKPAAVQYKRERVSAAVSEYEVFAFADRPVYWQNPEPVTYRVLSADGIIVAECAIFDRATVIDHWTAIMHAAGLIARPRFTLDMFRGTRVGGIALEHRPRIAAWRYQAGMFSLPVGPPGTNGPAPWRPQ